MGIAGQAHEGAAGGLVPGIVEESFAVELDALPRSPRRSASTARSW